MDSFAVQVDDVHLDSDVVSLNGIDTCPDVIADDVALIRIAVGPGILDPYVQIVFYRVVTDYVVTSIAEVDATESVPADSIACDGVVAAFGAGDAMAPVPRDVVLKDIIVLREGDHYSGA